MKRKALLVLGALALVLAVTSGALATTKWIITKSSQVKPGSISYKNLSAAARLKLQGQVGPPGSPGAPGTSALEQFSGNVNHGQTVCIGSAGKQGPCLGANYAGDNNGLVFGPLPAGLMVQRLTVAAATAPNIATYTVSVLDNGASTPLTCTVATLTTTCSDSADSFTTTGGDFVEVQVKNDAGNVVNSRLIVSFAY